MDHGSKKRWETVVGKGWYKGNEEMLEKLALLLKKRIITNIIYRNIPNMVLLDVKNSTHF